ncbi:hypothetical protein [Paenibacillus beijingensis]|uniref:hypothetical protein n=1 Tax=Paenibacillus beijingensis TaxID=1126833 RepID=UPI000AF5FE02|nr:hypothetical protein [Paenibacillus beijingensis]
MIFIEIETVVKEMGIAADRFMEWKSGNLDMSRKTYESNLLGLTADQFSLDEEHRS